MNASPPGAMQYMLKMPEIGAQTFEGLHVNTTFVRGWHLQEELLGSNGSQHRRYKARRDPIWRAGACLCISRAYDTDAVHMHQVDNDPF